MKALFVSILVALSGAALAQAPASTSPQQRQAMEKIAWMAGVWEGASTMDRGPQGQAQNISWERVRRAAGGTALLVEGRHWRRLPEDKRGEVVHDAAALITFDAASGKYRFVAQLADGSYQANEAWMDGDVFVWQTRSPHGVVRFRISHEAERWTERGEFCPAAEGAPCKPFFQMSLARVGETRD